MEKESMLRLSGKRVLVGVTAVLVMAAAGCSSTGGKASTNSSAGGVSGGKASTPHMTFALISHAPAGDAFFDVIQRGAKDAAAKDNITLKYSGSGAVPEQANFIQNAIDSKVDGIAVSMPAPAALSPVIKKAADAGIPVIVYNAGDRDWQKTGALAFYGEPELLAGQYAGAKLAQLGTKHALCVVQAQGQVQLEDRCAGIKSDLTGGTTTEIFADGTNLPGFVSTVTAKLAQDPSIDAVVTLGPALGVAMAQAMKQAKNTKVKVVTYAFNSDLIPLLKDGSVAFTIDQQPYLQGYLSIDSLWLYKLNKSVVGAQLSVPTGPVVVDKSNIGQITSYISAGLR
jgi:simple sugar transport system substrate-binding protein